MSPETRGWLESLLGSDDPVERAHAAARLAMPAEIEPPIPATEPARASEPPDPWRERIRECPDYQPGCCSSPAPFCGRFGINPTRERCIECLSRDS